MAILFIETSGCLPMCGHGTIGAVTLALEHGLVQPKTPGALRLDTPAGLVLAGYVQNGPYVEEVRITNVASYLHETGLTAECPGLGTVTVDVAYGGNFYAIVEPQAAFQDIADVTAGDLIRWSPLLRKALNARYRFIHPEQPDIQGLSHILWTGAPRAPGADARNAVFYGEKAIDRSPCGTGTSARMAQLAARGALQLGEDFVHESIIGSLFKGRVEAAAEVGGRQAIIPSIAGWARMTGYNTIFIDDRDPFARGFQVI
jgi:4-hydroxyproline epimerase